MRRISLAPRIQTINGKFVSTSDIIVELTSRNSAADCVIDKHERFTLLGRQRRRRYASRQDFLPFHSTSFDVVFEGPDIAIRI
jgi:hypothetical protein